MHTNMKVGGLQSIFQMFMPCYATLSICHTVADPVLTQRQVEKGPWHKARTRNYAFLVSLNLTFTLDMISTHPPTQQSTILLMLAVQHITQGSQQQNTYLDVFFYTTCISFVEHDGCSMPCASMYPHVGRMTRSSAQPGVVLVVGRPVGRSGETSWRNPRVRLSGWLDGHRVPAATLPCSVQRPPTHQV